MSEWKKVKLGEITIIKTGKLDSNAAVPNGAYPFFTCDPTTLSIDKWAYDTEAILLAGNNASGNYTAKYYKGKFNAYQRTYIIETLNPQFASVRYMAYAMNQQLQLLKVMSSGSTTKFLTMKMLTQLSIDLPSIETQNRIATILSRYDSLIENYQKQIKLLEEAAQRLYKEWFVDLHFPGHENTKIVDGVPEGWEKKCIAELGSVITGKTPSTSKRENYGGSIPFITIPDMHTGIFPVSSQFLSDIGANSQKGKFIPADSLMVSCIGTAGLVCISSRPCQTNQQINSLVLHDKRFLYFLYYAFLMLKEHLNNIGSNGATMTNVNKSKFESISLLIPTGNLISSYNDKAKPYFKNIRQLSSQIRLLTEARDRLLPKLMSGEIAV